MLLVRGIFPSFKATIIGLIVVIASGRLRAADESIPMTVEKFREITSRPGDSVPLQPKLAMVPWWTNTVANVVVTNFMIDGNFIPDGTPTVSKVVSRGKARTVKGKYIVFFSEPESNQPARKTILTYDEQTSAYKSYSTFGTAPGNESLVEGTMVYDFTNKTYSATNTFGGNWKVITRGSYSKTHRSETSALYEGNHLLAVNVLEIEPAKPESQR